MSTAKILQSTDTFAPHQVITSFDDFKANLKALLVTGISELGGTCGWTEQFNDDNGWVLRDGNTGNNRDWIIRDWVRTVTPYDIVVDVRGCDTASSSTTGVNIFPSEANRPYESLTFEQYSPMFPLYCSSATKEITSWSIIATDKVVYIITQPTDYKYYTDIDDNYGWTINSFGHFKGHGANVETAMVTGSDIDGNDDALENNMFMGVSETLNTRFIQRSPNGDPGNGMLMFMTDADKVGIKAVGDTATRTINTFMYDRIGLPTLSSTSAPVILSDVWLRHASVTIGSMFGMKMVNAGYLPAVAQGNVATLADGKDYAFFRLGGISVLQGPLIAFNLTDDWDA